MEGRIWSSKGGAWTESASPTRERLGAIGGAGSLLVAVGDRGTIVTSKDGTRWRLEKSPTRETLRAMWVADDGRAIATGENGVLLARTPSGSWTRLKTRSRDYWARIGRQPDGALLILGTAGGLLRSTDDGRHFQPLESLPLNLRSYCDQLAIRKGGIDVLCHAAAPGTEIVKEPPMHAVLLRSTDGAKTWREEPIDAPISLLFSFPDSEALYGAGAGVFRHSD
jgi:photosystem II stability/assembly factor-like uncharacterized protein